MSDIRSEQDDESPAQSILLQISRKKKIYIYNMDSVL